MNFLKTFMKSIFNYNPHNEYNFSLDSESNCDFSLDNLEPKYVFQSLKENLEFLKSKYNALISNDIIFREFSIYIHNKQYNSFAIYIDGMIDSPTLNESVLKPLMKKNSSSTSNTFTYTQSISDYIQTNLIPQACVKKQKDYRQIFSSINMGNCLLFVDSLECAFDIDIKGFKQRNIDTPNNEVVIRGSQEAFVENIRTNTSIIRRIINNENLIFESLQVGRITNTQISVGYIKDLANLDLVSEVVFRISNLKIDYLISSGQLEQLIQDSPSSLFPQMLATERPDKVCNYLLEGRVVILVNGSPYALVAPGVFSDFLSSPEDLNLKFQFANLERLVRFIAIILSVLLPGIYIAVTGFHQELIPTELLFTIAAARGAVPFPTFVDILLMEVSFELIREAGLRVPSPLGATIGIVGTLILGEAAVSASLVSPILIIVVAITAICSYSIPDFSLSFTFRILRFIYMILGYIAGFLGIGLGIFVQLVLMCNLKSFGAPYITPFALGKNKRSISSYIVFPIWKRERTSGFIHAKQKYSQSKISMNWRNINH